MTQARDAYDALLDGDPVLRGIADIYGRPDPFRWDVGGRTGSSDFAAIMLHVVSQQISTAVAFVIFDRISAAAGAIPSPQNVVALGQERLRALGLSRAKAIYVTDLARVYLTGALDTERLEALDDRHVIEALMVVRGVGLWTAEVFLIHQLRRPDVLPAGDLAIRRAIQKAWSLSTVPTIKAVRELGLKWSPYRSYAAALLWASLYVAPGRPGPAAK
jgi:DNA-3-methyladenine glycosylase II